MIQLFLKTRILWSSSLTANIIIDKKCNVIYYFIADITQENSLKKIIIIKLNTYSQAIQGTENCAVVPSSIEA